jgi:hypothetical protein
LSLFIKMFIRVQLSSYYKSDSLPSLVINKLSSSFAFDELMALINGAEMTFVSFPEFSRFFIHFRKLIVLFDNFIDLKSVKNSPNYFISAFTLMFALIFMISTLPR